MRTEEFRDSLDIPGMSRPPRGVLRMVRSDLRRRRIPATVPMQAVISAADGVALLSSLLLADQLGGSGLAFVIAAFVTMRSLGAQASHISPRLAESMARVLGSIAVPLVVVALLQGSAAQAGHFLVLAPFAVGLVLLERGLLYGLIRTARARGVIRENTLIVGAGEVGQQVASALREHPEYGLVPVGFIDSVDDRGLPLPVLGDVNELTAIVSEWAVQRVIVAFGLTREPSLVEVLRAADQLPVEVHLVPRFFELGVSAEGPFRDDVWGIPLIRLRRSALRSLAWRIKRVMDLLVGSLLLVVTSPLMLAAAVTMRATSRGPVLFRQVRIGQRGRAFECLKFRTMEMNDGSDTDWSVEGDERVTAVGRFLRWTSLDELPQLLNVVKGNMSLIGPRPERPFFVDRFSQEVARYNDRHRVPAGITGWAQVHGLRGDTSIPERVRFDNYYIEHWSPWLDTVIFFRTIGLILAGRH